MMNILSLFNAEAEFDALLRPYRVKADRIMIGVNVFLTLLALALTPLHASFVAFGCIALPVLLMSMVLGHRYAGSLLTRMFMAGAFMAYTALLRYQTGAELEAYFLAIGLMSLLLYYRDWRLILVTAMFISAHDGLFSYVPTPANPLYAISAQHAWWPGSIYAAYFIPFLVMMRLAVWLRREGYESQQVIALAQRIVQGNLAEDDSDIVQVAHMPLITSVVLMKRRLLDLLRIMPVAAAVIRVDTEAIFNVNAAWIRMMGPLDDSKRISAAAFWSKRNNWADLIAAVRLAEDKLLTKVEMELKKSNATRFWAEVSLILHDEFEPAMAIMTIEDITQRRKTEQAMRFLAFRDMLTNLPNRASLYAELELAVDGWQNKGIPFALIMLDLDEFKPINDNYGHNIGDEVLKVVGARILQTNRASDLAARLGGDEFVILLFNSPNAAVAGVTAQRFIESIAQPISLVGQAQPLQVGVSAGVMHIAEHVGKYTIDRILKNVDTALYHAKSAGKHQIAFFHPERVQELSVKAGDTISDGDKH